MLDFGEGTDQDQASAAVWYGTAMDQGHVGAMANLATLYEEGDGVSRDLVKAIALYRRAAEGGDSMAQYILGLLFEAGKGVDQDHAEAARLYTLEAEQGDVDAQSRLGWLLSENEPPGPDLGNAIDWLEKAAEQDSSRAMVLLGDLYEKGRGVSKNDETAEAYFRRAASRGYGDAMYRLGYRRQTVEPGEFAAAARRYREAMDAGYLVAAPSLAQSYMEGQGVEVDYEEAERLCLLALAQPEQQEHPGTDFLAALLTGTSSRPRPPRCSVTAARSVMSQTSPATDVAVSAAKVSAAS